LKQGSEKILPPESRSALSVAREYNLSVGTLYGWKARMHEGTLWVKEGVLFIRGSNGGKAFVVLESRSIAGEARRMLGEEDREHGVSYPYVKAAMGLVNIFFKPC
jgi:hypothetical protein